MEIDSWIVGCSVVGCHPGTAMACRTVPEVSVVYCHQGKRQNVHPVPGARLLLKLRKKKDNFILTEYQPCRIQRPDVKTHRSAWIRTNCHQKFKSDKKSK